MKLKSLLLAMLIASMVATQPPQAVAQELDDGNEVERFNSTKFWDYALCGASIVFATGTGGWILAGIACGRAVTLYWSD